jgi:hypothetical protein
MSEVDSRRSTTEVTRPAESDVERVDETKLVERAPADAVEPALIQSGNPPRAFAEEDR